MGFEITQNQPVKTPKSASDIELMAVFSFLLKRHTCFAAVLTIMQRLAHFSCLTFQNRLEIFSFDQCFRDKVIDHEFEEL